MGALLALVLLWALVSWLWREGPVHRNGYDMITSSQASWNRGKGREPVIYLSVYFLNRGNWYYYRTEDPSVRPNDIVVVPWGRNNHPEFAIVGWVEQRTASDVPFPLSRTKYMIRKAGEEYRTVFEDALRWPLTVNVSQRWSRDEQGKALLVHNERGERRKLKDWIRKNPRLKIIEPISDLEYELMKGWYAGLD